MSSTRLKNKKVFLTGHTGQVGGQLYQLLKDSCVLRLYQNKDGSRSDLRDLHCLEDSLKSFRPDFIVNAGAYTAVDKAETDHENADLVNHRALAVIAQYAKEMDSVVIHYSTDYVFDGAVDHLPWRESDTPSPINHYGLTKRRGEEVLEESGIRFLCFRTSWVYGALGHNFLKTILRLAKERELLKVVSDQTGAPTCADFLATTTLSILDRLTREDGRFSAWGIYHLCSSGETTWYEFARAIVDKAREGGADLKCKEIQPLTSAEYPTPARRPFNSRLDCAKFDSVFAIVREDWKKGLVRTLDLILE